MMNKFIHVCVYILLVYREVYNTEPLLLTIAFYFCTLSCFRELMSLYRQQSVCELINCWAYKIQPLLHRSVVNVELVWVANIDLWLLAIIDRICQGFEIHFQHIYIYVHINKEKLIEEINISSRLIPIKYAS